MCRWGACKLTKVFGSGLCGVLLGAPDQIWLQPGILGN
jgi:hypothetical protein